MPLGLTLNLNGLLTGTPTAAGSKTANICAKDTGGFYACQKITINVEQSYLYDGHYSLKKCASYSHSSSYGDQSRGSTEYGSGYIAVNQNIAEDPYGGTAAVNADGTVRIVKKSNDPQWSDTVTDATFYMKDGKMWADTTETSTSYWGGETETYTSKCSGTRGY